MAEREELVPLGYFVPTPMLIGFVSYLICRRERLVVGLSTLFDLAYHADDPSAQPLKFRLKKSMVRFHASLAAASS